MYSVFVTVRERGTDGAFELESNAAASLWRLVVVVVLRTVAVVASSLHAGGAETAQGSRPGRCQAAATAAADHSGQHQDVKILR